MSSVMYVRCCVCQVLCMSGGGAGTSQDVVNQIVNTVKCCVCQVVELVLAYVCQVVELVLARMW